jgi:hypothetical protein
MGVDVMLFARGLVTDEQLAAANEFVHPRCSLSDPDRTTLTREGGDPELIIFDTLDRYYGPGYERGWWPSIYNDIVVTREALPMCTIHYGSDSLSYDDIPPVTEEFLSNLWRYWLSPDGLNYKLPRKTL